MTTQRKMYEIEMNVNELRPKAERAKQLSDDLCGYFGYDVEDEKSRDYALYDFDKHRIYSHILFDYMKEIFDISNELTTLIDLLNISEVQKSCQKLLRKYF